MLPASTSAAPRNFVAVPPDRDDEPVREFPSFTADLHALADWLQVCGVDTVAMESTGVYWIPLYELLDAHGFTVLLVNARHVKNVSGRKSDVLDCQWLQQLMTYGLLRGAFRPADAVCALRSLSRQREMLLRGQGRQVQDMQKALTQMNLQLANVISDVAGGTGQKILRAIVAGERDGHALAALRDVRIRASAEQIAKSLQGHWHTPSICSRSSKRWPRSTSAARNWPSATASSRRNSRTCTFTRATPPRASSAAARATRPSSTCTSTCSSCAAWISHASTALTSSPPWR